MDHFAINEYNLSGVEYTDKPSVLKYIKTIYCMNLNVERYSIINNTYYYTLEFSINKKDFSLTNLDLLKLSEICDVSYVESEFFIKGSIVCFKLLLRKFSNFEISTNVKIIQEERYKESAPLIESVISDPSYEKGLKMSQNSINRELEISNFYKEKREKDLKLAESVVLEIKKSNIVETCELDDDPFYFFVIKINFKKGISLSRNAISGLFSNFGFLLKAYKIEIENESSFCLYATMEKQNGYEFKSTIITRIEIETTSLNKDTHEVKKDKFVDSKSIDSNSLIKDQHVNGSYIRKKFKAEQH
jgi:hypothetical protein